MKIAFSGMKGSGKDYCINSLNGDGKLILGFSDQLRYIGEHLFPWFDAHCLPENKDEHMFYNPITNTYWSYRDVLTKIDILREIDPDIFIRPLEKTYKELFIDHERGKYDTCIIKDLRPHNPHELIWCLDNGFEILHITCDEQPEITHVSEQGYIDNIVPYASWHFHNRKNGPQDFINFWNKEVRGV